MIYKGFRVVEVSLRPAGKHGLNKKRRAQKGHGRTLRIHLNVFSIKYTPICFPRGSIASEGRLRMDLALQLGQVT